MQYWCYLELDRLRSLIKDDDDGDHYHSHINLFVGMSNRKSAAAVDWYGIYMGVSEQKKYRLLWRTLKEWWIVKSNLTQWILYDESFQC
jgi:hypothetical protein